MNRRSFLSRVGAAVIGLTLARHLPGIAPKPIDVIAPPVAHTFTPGDIVTIEGQYAHHPVTGRPTPYLQRFVVTADVTSQDEPMQTWPRIANYDRAQGVPLERFPEFYPWEATPLLVGRTA